MNTEPDVDIDDDTLPADDAPPEAALFDEADPAQIPPDEGDADAERKEDTE